MKMKRKKKRISVSILSVQNNDLGNWFFYLMVYQENIKKMTFFLTKVVKLPELDSVVKRLWFIYIDRWRESGYPLLSKFTFSNPGHFERGISSKKHPGTTHNPIPLKVIKALEERQGATEIVKESKKKSLNYDLIFGGKGLSFLKAKNPTDFYEKNEAYSVFLDEYEMKKAKDFYMKSKRRYKSVKHIQKKALNNQKGRRRSSLIKDYFPSKKDHEIDKIRALDELEVTSLDLGHLKRRSYQQNKFLENFRIAF